MSELKPNPETRIALFQRKEVRRTIHNNEWWFVIADAVAALTDSVDPQGYIKDMRRRDPELAKGWGQIATPLSIQTAGGPQNLNCANTEGLFRIIQSIPSPKAEPFKRWLAKVGYERVQEIEDPELATRRTRALYKAKGYSNDWIEKRMRAIAIRDELTDEWKKRGVREQREYAILTAEISKATFGLTPTQYAEFKRLKRENLRDHMTDLELIFSMLGEASTTEITRTRDAQGFPKNKQAAHAGGTVAGNARRELEAKSGRKVVTSQNYLALTESAKQAKQLAGKRGKKKAHHPPERDTPRRHEDDFQW
ncbi:MAG: Bro-N domain-containing protein [Verrucomicrobiae bacterium]|nr:Bro-N domain-containing protein [Verrucomicrobiae bacterium]